jgi:hypothetical protein
MIHKLDGKLASAKWMPQAFPSRGQRIKGSKNGNGKDFSFPGRPEV